MGASTTPREPAMRLAIVGTGYVGLVTGACFAEFGNDVVCVDIDRARVGALRAGQVPFFEPGLPDLVARNTSAGRLRFETDLPRAVSGAEIVFLAVGTPPDDDGGADVSQVLEAARDVAAAADGPVVLVTKSTVPVGTGDRVEEVVREHARHPIEVVANPEFLKEGDAVNDFLKPDRVIVGTESGRARALLADLYAPYMRTRDRLLFMDRRSAEVTKYAANGLLATRISFMNEIARLCERVGADVTSVRHGVGSDPRIGPQFLFPGVGFGGSCLPKDVAALCHTARGHDETLLVLEAVRSVNARQKRLLVDKVVARFGDDLSGRCFALWGLAFKPGTDDMREAPSLTVIEGLLARGARVVAHDPEAREAARALLGDRIGYADDPYAACDGANALLVVTEWSVYRNPDLERVRDLLAEPVVFDGRNLYRPGRLKVLGLEHHPVGRPATRG